MASADKNMKKVAIIGCGLIGPSWAVLFAGAGYTVSLFDLVSTQVTAALERVQQMLQQQSEQGLLRGTLSAADQFRLISGCSDLNECLQGAVYVQECVPDVRELKQKVFEQLDKLVDDHVILASSSSVIPCSTFTEQLKHRSQCIVAHPVNPPYLMPLVELVPAPWTHPNTLDKTKAIMKELGQTPVVVRKEVAGFIQPRLQYAMLMECIRLVKDDVISVEDVDKILTSGLGLRYSFIGPMEAIHLNAEGVQNYCQRYADMIYGINNDAGPPVQLDPDSEDMKKIFDQLCEQVPVEKLAERCAWRDQNLAALNKLRNEMDRQDDA